MIGSELQSIARAAHDAAYRPPRRRLVVNLCDEDIGHWQRRWCKKLPRQNIKLALKPSQAVAILCHNNREGRLGTSQLSNRFQRLGDRQLSK